METNNQPSKLLLFYSEYSSPVDTVLQVCCSIGGWFLGFYMKDSIPQALQNGNEFLIYMSTAAALPAVLYQGLSKIFHVKVQKYRDNKEYRKLETQSKKDYDSLKTRSDRTQTHFKTKIKNLENENRNLNKALTSRKVRGAEICAIVKKIMDSVTEFMENNEIEKSHNASIRKIISEHYNMVFNITVTSEFESEINDIEFSIKIDRSFTDDNIDEVDIINDL